MELRAGYELDELLPMVAWLSDKYTSRESSSVTYDTANMLMEAVIYCINECFDKNDTGVSSEKLPAIRVVYDKGCSILLKKVKRANQIYESMINGFEDFGCRNYRETILKGMPSFFLKYDSKFNPSDHILTLDYPQLVHCEDLCGGDLILKYLEGIRLEAQFLKRFQKNAVMRMLEQMMPDYRSGYMDNLCEPVLKQAVFCMISDMPVRELMLTEESSEEIRRFFMEDNLDKAELKIKGMIRVLIAGLSEGDEDGTDVDVSGYFEKAARNIAARVLNSMEL